MASHRELKRHKLPDWLLLFNHTSATRAANDKTDDSELTESIAKACKEHEKGMQRACSPAPGVALIGQNFFPSGYKNRQLLSIRQPIPSNPARALRPLSDRQ
jgi:hypothetical protein